MAKVIKNKASLRKEALKIRNELFNQGLIEKKSKEIIQKIINLDCFKKADNVALYYPINSEINLLKLLNEDKNFFFPKCEKTNLHFVKYKQGLFEKGEFNIPCPVGKIIDNKILDLILIPCLMANRSCYRLGYGKGCYDRFFKENENIKAKKIIVAPSILITDDFIAEEFDYKCDMVISEKDIIIK